MEKLKKEHAKESQDLYAEIGRLMTELSWLKNLACRLSRNERMALINWDDPDISISVQVGLLGLNRASVYYKRRGPSDKR